MRGRPLSCPNRLSKHRALSPRTLRERELLEGALRRWPVDTGVGDALAVGQLGRIRAFVELLAAADDVTLDHDTEDVRRALGHLAPHLIDHVRLLQMALATVVVAAVDEDARLDAGQRERRGRRRDLLRSVVWPRISAAQDDVPVAV